MPIQQTQCNDKPQTDSRALTGNIDDEHAVLVKLALYVHDGEEGEGGGQRGVVQQRHGQHQHQEVAAQHQRHRQQHLSVGRGATDRG